MSRTRHASPGNQATRPHSYLPSGWDPGAPRPGVARLLGGAGLCVLVLLLGALAKIGPIALLDLRADERIAHHRFGALTALAKFATTIGTPETVGVGLMVVVPLLLVLARRRLDAAKVFCMFAGAFTLAEIGKKLIGEHRPPASLQVVAADSGASFPSGHATTAAVLAVALIVIATPLIWRATAIVLGGLYAVAVAASRVYLGDHYPLDVLGGIFCALAAGLVVTGLFALPATQPWLRRIRLTASPGATASAALPAHRGDGPDGSA